MEGANKSDPWGLTNVELLQQLGNLMWIEGNPELTEQVAKLRIGYELYQRLSGQRELEALRTKTILEICKWVKDNPRASKDEMTREIGQRILIFAAQVDNL